MIEKQATPGATGVHDLGGVPSNEPIDLSTQDKAYAFWERQMHAVVLLLAKKNLLTVDELRRGVEALPAYHELSYYEKWASSVTAISIERGTFTQLELDEALGVPLVEPTTPRYAKGDLVRVKAENASVRWRKPHLRTPGYIFGVVGVIERDCLGLSPDAEAVAFRAPAPRQPLYRVRFRQRDVWEGYAGQSEDGVDIEIPEPWLLPATQEELDQQGAAATAAAAVLTPGHAAAASAATPTQTHKRQRTEGHDHDQDHDHGHDHHHNDEHGHDHEHDHSHVAEVPGHGHEHGHGHHNDGHGRAGHSHAHRHGEGEEEHTHEAREAVEAAAVEKEGDDSQRRILADALVKVLTSKGVFTPSELRASLEAMDDKGTHAEGPRIVAKAWTDPDFKSRLLADAAAAAGELGVTTSNFAPVAGTGPSAAVQPPSGGLKALTGTVLTALENTDDTHHVIVCTLCSCYPVTVLGMSPPWYKSRAYRARLVRDPRAVLLEFGTELPASTRIVVVDSTADLRYIVIPKRPAGTEGWDEERLQSLVTRDSMIGVAFAKSPAAAA